MIAVMFHIGSDHDLGPLEGESFGDQIDRFRAVLGENDKFRIARTDKGCYPFPCLLDLDGDLGRKLVDASPPTSRIIKIYSSIASITVRGRNV